MSADPVRCVLDASVGIQLFVEEEFSARVAGLFAQLAEETAAELHIPDLFYIECTNILLKYSRRFGRPLKDSQADLADLRTLALKSTSTADLMEDALLLAQAKGLSAYDACYAVLAQRLGIPLVTADRQVVKAVDWAVWVGDFDF
ncbi:MAG: type II toxin-antitoxin system VapC family toxin [Anaerolineales bacterium]